MIGRLFGKRAKKDQSLAAQFGVPTDVPSPMDIMNADFLHEVHGRLFQTYLRRGQFQGSFDAAEGFVCQTEDNGMQVAVHREHKFQAIMAEHQIGLSGVGYTPVHWTLVHLGTFAKYHLNGEPDWQSVDGGLTGILPFGKTAFLTFDCKEQDNIDFDFSGRADTGATLIIQVKTRNLQ